MTKDSMLCVPVVIKTSNFKIISRCHLADCVKEVYFSACSALHGVSVTIYYDNFSLYLTVIRAGYELIYISWLLSAHIRQVREE